MPGVGDDVSERRISGKIDMKTGSAALFVTSWRVEMRVLTFAVFAPNVQHGVNKGTSELWSEPFSLVDIAHYSQGFQHQRECVF